LSALVCSFRDLRPIPERSLSGSRAELAQVPEALGAPVRFERHDFMSDPVPTGMDFVLCRYLAFTCYRGERLREASSRLHQVLSPGGALMIGRKEQIGPGGENSASGWTHPGSSRRGKLLTAEIRIRFLVKSAFTSTTWNASGRESKKDRRMGRKRGNSTDGENRRGPSSRARAGSPRCRIWGRRLCFGSGSPSG